MLAPALPVLALVFDLLYERGRQAGGVVLQLPPVDRSETSKKLFETRNKRWITCRSGSGEPSLGMSEYSI